ncbi:DUF4274 domain-containing protein [Corynebacterium sp.]|uniref:DUF4274 domain-containing protein n=1 Tax=Corynebacterium sp. TaxID=1720 RepID=UPI0026DBD5F1|nr:DUF4274 domain-containing protein [Corynebacterium sp.]MDO5077072.1 DUF4274 domain-containing protein [Corynebacterium sp.]
MITQTRKHELDLLHIRACVAGDDYYVDLDDHDFRELMEDFEITEESAEPGCRALFAAHCRQREVGFTPFQEEVRGEFAGITSPEELHYLAKDYNFDDGFWVLEQIINNPFCDIRTARMLFWLSEPEYIATRFGHPAHAPGDGITEDHARFLTQLDAKAHRGEFLHDLPAEFESPEIDTTAGQLWGIAADLQHS